MRADKQIDGQAHRDTDMLIASNNKVSASNASVSVR